MKHKISILIVILFSIITTQNIILTPVCHAGVDTGFVRGLVWNKMSESNKLFYLAGFFDAASISPKQTNEKTILNEISLSTSTESYKNALNDFYKDYKNDLIPTNFALYFISLELKGTSEEIVQEKLRLLRRELSNIQEEKDKTKE